jgi:hypothetical protein
VTVVGGSVVMAGRGNVVIVLSKGAAEGAV